MAGDTGDATLAPAWPLLPEHLRKPAQSAIADYRALPPDPLGEVYGFFTRMAGTWPSTIGKAG